MAQVERLRKRQAQERKHSRSRRLKYGLLMVALAVAVLSVIFMANRTRENRTLRTPIFVSNGTAQNDPGLMAPWDDAAISLSLYSDHPVLGSHASNLLAHLPEYRAKVEAAFKHAQGLPIDYITSLHMGYGGEDAETEKLIKHSQEGLYRLLEYLDPDVFSIESPSCDDLTEECYRQEFLHEAIDQGQPMTPAEAQETLDMAIRVGGGERYWHKHLGRKLALGAEEQILHDMHYNSLSFIPQVDPAGVRDYSNELLEPLSHLRTDVAIARMIGMLLKHPGKRGVIELGSGHAPRFQQVFQALGTRSRIFQTDNW